MAEMVTFLITSLFVLVFLVVAVYFWQKPADPHETELLLPPLDGRGLFAGDASENEITAEDKSLGEAQRAEIITRARGGDKSALTDAQKSNDPALYNEALSVLTAGAEGPQLLSLLSYLSRHDLRINSEAAEKFIQYWKETPNRNTTAEMLHVAAVSDDAQTYRIAVEAALQCWQSGHLADVSAPELRSIIDGEFWILSSQTRSSGAGFLLKQSLAETRRLLEAEAERNLRT